MESSCFFIFFSAGEGPGGGSFLLEADPDADVLGVLGVLGVPGGWPVVLGVPSGL